MSSWYILSALGIYPLDPASGEYELGSPLVDRARIDIAGRRLVITVRRSRPGSWRTVRVSFNGRELANRRIAHADLAAGGEVVFEQE